MGCMSHRRRDVEVRPEQKWDYISLNDFKSNSCWAPFAYTYLWFSLLLSTAVYAVDTFTAIQLLVFNHWSSSIQLTQLISFDIARWVFSICIILSFVNLAFEQIRARRIMNRGSVAECYLDNLAVRLESMRMGKGRGWKRFLVFAELTKSKKGAEYVALFTYFSFQSWIRVIICSGPRQVINALTLYSVYNARLQINGDTFESSITNFFSKIQALATENYQQALVLSGMLFTLVIWLFSFLSLLLAAAFFVFFLWHYIPRADGGLSGYCERKANKRLMQIVSIKINKAMEEDERKRRKAEFKSAKKNGGDRPVSLKATLPNVEMDMDKLPEMPMLNRNDTMSTLPPYTSRPGTPGSIELNSLDQKRPMPSRTGTMASSSSQFSSRAPLLGQAEEFGRSSSPAPTLPNIDMNNYPPARTGTAASNRSYGGPQLNRMPTNGSLASAGGFSSNQSSFSADMPPMPAPVRSPAGPPNGYRGPVGSRPTMDDYQMPNGRSTPVNGRPPRQMDEFSNGRASPAPSATSYRSGPTSPRGPGPNGYGPARSATNPMPPRGPMPYAPQRNMTAPMGPMHQSNGSGGPMPGMRMPQPLYQQQQPQQERNEFDYFNRPGTANSQRAPPSRGQYGNGDVERGGGSRY